MTPAFNKFVCIHAHFYQPPRENPWLEAIEPQKTAAPFKDWNERITVECYAPNAFARILNEKGQIEKIVNNYSKISFNFGPTLLTWMQQKAPDVYQAILEADKESQTYFGGHGSALAQPYNHMIMPLASREDKITQTVWGVKDFEYRFRRTPEGMWLPETAVDTETLEILADLGIKYTILAPRQAKRVRAFGQTKWVDTPDETVDSSIPYVVKLPSGNSIAVFFYNNNLSHDIAFGDLLKSGDQFVNSILQSFPKKIRAESQLVHVATDGETYGHHHTFTEMALAYALNEIQNREDCQLTNYSQFLADNPPEFEAEIAQNTAWSCAHGVERWQSDCGCHTGGDPSWNQSWREPLRESLNSLRVGWKPQFEKLGNNWFKDPWEARNEYIYLILDRSKEKLELFFDFHAAKPLTKSMKKQALKLMEQQRQSMLMYTSCGWFFSEISGIETTQILLYAGRAIELGKELFENSGEKEFLKILETAKSNKPKEKNGLDIYQRAMETSKVSPQDLCGSIVELGLLNPKNAPEKLFLYLVESLDIKSVNETDCAVAYGYLRLRSEINLESSRFFFCGIRDNDDCHIFIKPCETKTACKTLETEFNIRLEKEGIVKTLQRMTTEWKDFLHTPTPIFSLGPEALIQREFKEEIREANKHFETLSVMVNALNRQYEKRKEATPKSLVNVLDIANKIQWISFIENDDLTARQMESFLENRDSKWVKSETFQESLQDKLKRLTERLKSKPTDVEIVYKLNIWLDFMKSLEIAVDVWKLQNVAYNIATQPTNLPTQEWTTQFESLLERSNIQLSQK